MKNRTRLVFQLVILGLILYVALRPFVDKSYVADFEQYCPFGGLSSVFSKLDMGAMACNMNETQVMLGLVLVLGVGVVGKLFCSHLCPIGTVSEWIGRWGKRFRLQREVPARLDRALRSLKYVLLFVTVYFTMTSGELFCKEYDPYFAVANGFANPDILLAYAIPAVLITLAGSFFLRLFWCKYLCPLGAFSNIFLNAAVAGGVIVLYIVLALSGVPVEPLWLLAALVVTGWVTEVGFMRSVLLPMPTITRNEIACTNCGHCDDHCPQGIEISTMTTVRHIDCHLCTDCAHACPLKNVLMVNNKPRQLHLAPAAAVALVAVGLFAANWMEFTTISLRWGTPSSGTAVLTQAGMKSIKCYGSSMALAGTLESIAGIVGVDTYVKSHRVDVFYDPSVIGEREVKASLFSSSKQEIRKPDLPLAEPVGVLDIGILGLFDAVDFRDLSALLSEREGVLGLETHFGEPVRATIYFLPTRETPAALIALLNRGTLMRNGERIEVGFKTADEGNLRPAKTFGEYKSLMFRQYDSEFNGYEEYDPVQLTVLRFPMPQAADAALQDQLDLLASHLSGNEAIVRFRTRFEGEVIGEVLYDPTRTTERAVGTALTSPVLTYFVTDTTTEQAPNPFQISVRSVRDK